MKHRVILWLHRVIQPSSNLRLEISWVWSQEVLAFLNLGVSRRRYPLTVGIFFFFDRLQKLWICPCVSREETHTRVMSIPNCTFGIALQGNCWKGLLCPRWKILADISGHVAPNWCIGGIWGTVGNTRHVCTWCTVLVGTITVTMPALIGLQGGHAQSPGSGPQNPKAQRLKQQMIKQISR